MVKLLWWLLNGVEAVALVVWSAFWITAALVVRLVTGSAEIPLAMARHIWAPGLLNVGYIRLRIEGREAIDFRRPYLFVMNHQSQVDICVAFRAVPVNLRFLVKDELRKVPFLGWYIAAMGMVFIDRRERLRSLRQLETVIELLRTGHSFLSFPEGSRSRDGRLRRFKVGVFLAAIEAGVPVLPVAVDGAAEILPPETFSVRPGIIRVRFGQPIETVGLEPEDRAGLARRARSEIEGMLEELRGRN
ncbi:MAG: lysophospholipid acyltransferase family protein [Acidobacteriota bacterium]|nr:lysophospholipid acyltransferase family protein [Acidobacteriota bacterium]